MFITFICIILILRFWQWYSTWCFMFTISRKLFPAFFAFYTYVLWVSFWKKLFHALTTYTATLYLLLFAFCTAHDFSYLSPLFFAFYACYSTFSACSGPPPDNLEQCKFCFHPLPLVHSVVFFTLSLTSTSLRLPPCRARLFGPTKHISGHNLHHQQQEQDQLYTDEEYRLFIPVLTWHSQSPSLDKEFQWVCSKAVNYIATLPVRLNRNARRLSLFICELFISLA